MHFKITSENLRDAINRVLGVVDRKSSRPILSNCLFVVEKSQLSIYASDLQVSAKFSCHIDAIETGSFCLNAKSIYDIARELPDSVVELKTNSLKNILELSCKEVKFSLLIVSSEEFPKLTFNEENKNGFTLSTSQILRIVSKTQHAISNDDTRYNLNGIFIQRVNNRLRAVATDGHVLALIDDGQVNEQSTGLDSGIIIPRKGVQELRKIADFYMDQQIKISVDENSIFINADDKFWLSIRLIAREYPRYQAVIPNKTIYSVNIDKLDLLTAVKRIKLLANEKSNAVKISLKPGQLRISANHPSLGDANEKIEVQYEGKEIDIGFNARYLIDTFSALDGENIEMEFNNEFSPVIIKGKQTPEFLGVVMPLRL
jgi:DNA polymerase-3 subunit beta